MCAENKKGKAKNMKRNTENIQQVAWLDWLDQIQGLMHDTPDDEIAQECPALRNQAERGIKSGNTDVYGCIKDMKKWKKDMKKGIFILLEEYSFCRRGFILLLKSHTEVHREARHAK